MPTALVFDYTSVARLLLAAAEFPEAFDLDFQFQEASLGK